MKTPWFRVGLACVLTTAAPRSQISSQGGGGPRGQFQRVVDAARQ